MEEYIAFDSHKHYSWVEYEQVETEKVRQYRLEHSPRAVRRRWAAPHFLIHFEGEFPAQSRSAGKKIGREEEAVFC